ncbi:MAG: putative porin [Verrucomicrobiota bacterium]|nr:putative porin [Verrucomicrobiota bacterium]
MFAKQLIFVVAAAGLLLGGITARAQDAGALLDLLVKKRIITDQEAEEVRSELTKEVAATPAGKLKMSTPITELEIYGDARLRYEVRTAESGSPDLITPRGENTQRNRERYRLRLGIRGTLADDWFFGLRLETSSNPRSTNVTFGDDSANGPFAKTSDGINVGQAYLGYKGFRDITLTAGRMPNPLITTLMVWDADINPEGLSEQWKHTFNLTFGGGGSSAAAAESYSKDGKSTAVAAVSEPHKIAIDVFANFAQFVYDDANPENPLGPRGIAGGNRIPNTDAFLLAWQIGAKVNFTKDIYFQVAPTLYNYTGTGDTFNTFFSGDPNFRRTPTGPVIALNQTGVNSLLVYDMPTEFGFKVGEIPIRVFGDFAVNLEGDERARAAGHPDKGDQRYAYQIGVGFGKIKAKHDWQLQAFYQHTEQFSLDPNLVDSDLYDSRVNMEGFAIQAGYALSDAVTFNLTYGYGQQADRSLGTGGVGDAFTLNPLRKYNIFQADLSVKF